MRPSLKRCGQFLLCGGTMKHWLCLIAAALAVSFTVIFLFAGAVLLCKAVIVQVGVKLFFALVTILAAAMVLAVTVGDKEDERD